ncbi:hypothetical protein DPEC_G00043380 [Dallia pectoralis]|uniref:Uncharacterized protein n=1 Tax=Dallia pectoralis TaxID=75939 RepID=A0ACC2H9N8_DALPE|nr:hypothetical protein DPEC_G00043380 [Dallia pectoralis]
MCISALFTWLLLMLPLYSKARRYYTEAINPDDIRLNISESAEGVKVNWRKPKGKAGHCFESRLQYKTHCIEWKEQLLKDFSYLVRPGIKSGYEFRVQMRYTCLVNDPQNWSTWTPSTYWRNVTDSCSTKEYTWINANVYVGTILTIITCFLLLVAFQQKRFRQLFLPQIPDPKHISGSYFSMDHLNGPSTFTSPITECEIVYIEILSSVKNENGDEEVREEKDAEESTVIDPCAYLKDINLYTNQEVNAAYSCVCSCDE